MKRTLVARVRRGAARLTVNDVVAGVSMALVLVPQALAYAALAGLPPYVGLYAAALPPIAAALFASSPYLQTGPAAVTSILVAGALAPLAATGGREYMMLAALLALTVGLIRVAIGMLRGGRIVYLMSEPVLRGFTSGAAVLIVLSQLPVILGLPERSAGAVGGSLVRVLSNVEPWRLDAVLLAAVAFGVTYALRRVNPRLPGVLIVTVGALVYSVLARYDGPVMGDVPRTFLSLDLRLPWTRLPALVLPGVVIALVGFSEAASIARMYAARERQRWDPDRDFISQGAANLAAGLTGAFPVGGSFSRSGLAHLLGARTAWSGATTGLAVLAFMPFAGILAPLPRAVLGALVLVAVIPLVRLRPIIALWRLSRPQFVVASSTFVLTILLAPRIDEAVVLGIALAIAVHLWREFRVKLNVWTEDDALHVRPEGVLWFGSAQVLEREVVDLLAEREGVRRLVLHMERLGRVDLTASLVLETLITETRAAGLAVEIVAIHPTTAKALRRVLRRGTD